MPSFESENLAILDFAWLLGELPETWTAPDIYLKELNLQKIYRKLSVSVSFTCIQVTLEVQQRDQDATVREQHRNLRRAPHGRRSPDQMHPPGPVRTFRAGGVLPLLKFGTILSGILKNSCMPQSSKDLQDFAELAWQCESCIADFCCTLMNKHLGSTMHCLELAFF